MALRASKKLRRDKSSLPSIEDRVASMAAALASDVSDPRLKGDTTYRGEFQEHVARP